MLRISKIFVSQLLIYLKLKYMFNYDNLRFHEVRFVSSFETVPVLNHRLFVFVLKLINAVLAWIVYSSPPQQSKIIEWVYYFNLSNN